MTIQLHLLRAAALSLCLVLAACGDDDDDGATEAQRQGVGAACTSDDGCNQDLDLVCLPFKGGYCGRAGCSADANCPSGSACVTHDDGQNYCFLICADKPECNVTRSPDEESNCSSNIVFADGDKNFKACVPPS